MNEIDIAKYNLLLDIKKRIENLDYNPQYIEDWDDNHGSGYAACKHDILELLDKYLKREYNE